MSPRELVGPSVLVATFALIAGCGTGGDSDGTIVASRGGSVFTFAPDGSGRARLPGIDGAGDVAWSPDGRRLALTDGEDVYVVGRDGRDRRLVLRHALFPAWSPDGKRLAVTHDRCFPRDCAEVENPNEVYVVGVDGRGLRRLTFDDGYDGEPSWSPDGRRIVYSKDDGLFLVNPDGTGRRRLTRDGYQQGPVWSPDGRSVLYDTFLDVFAVDVETGRVRRLTRNPGPDRSAAWSPDGKRIVFLSEAVCAHCFSAEDPLEVWLMNADGSGARRIAPGKGYADVDWR
jgi:Tol biopolymer transport system component